MLPGGPLHGEGLALTGQSKDWSSERRVALWAETHSQPQSAPSLLQYPVRVSLVLVCSLQVPAFLLSLSLVSPQTQLGQAICTHFPPVAGDQGLPDASPAFQASLSIQGFGGPWGLISPRTPLHLSDHANYGSQHFPNGTKFKKFAIRCYRPAGGQS